ncbi:MAG: hypothetical protein ACREB7_04685 [Sphingopyxis sp.]|uniref:hypothetical protein n=1 Tax=Sphingopyxis sp. TaxID=1908224 RepID=UPI003D6C748A
MVDVTDGADVAVRLRPLKFSLGHDGITFLFNVCVDQSWTRLLNQAPPLEGLAARCKPARL